MGGNAKRYLKQKKIMGGLLMSFASAGAVVWANAPAPAEHQGLSVETLGKISEGSLNTQVDLDGHILLLRAITIAPGGQIAKHSHAKVPGLVKVISGEWTEGRQSGEQVFNIDTPSAILEDSETTHWFYNRGDEPATAIVCDIKPAG